MAESSKSSGSSGSGSSATQERRSRTDAALESERSGGTQRSAKDEQRYGIERDSDGNVKPLEYPERDLGGEVTYRDPKPLDWPQKADRRIYIGPVHQADSEEDVSKGDYIDTAGIDDKDDLSLGGDEVKDFQVVAGGNHLTLIINGQAHSLNDLGGGLSSELQQALLVLKNT